MGFRIAKGPFEMGPWDSSPTRATKLRLLDGERSIERAQTAGFNPRINRSGRFTHEPTDQRRWSSQDLALVIGQGFLAIPDPALPFVKENGHGTKEGEIACRGGIADRAAIFILGAISSEVLAVFNAPMDPRPFEQLFGTGFLYPEAGHQVSDLHGFLDDFPFAKGLNTSSDPDELSRSSQTDRRRINRHAPELALFDPTVFFIGRLSLRGEECRAAVVRLWSGRASGCP